MLCPPVRDWSCTGYFLIGELPGRAVEGQPDQAPPALDIAAADFPVSGRLAGACTRSVPTRKHATEPIIRLIVDASEAKGEAHKELEKGVDRIEKHVDLPSLK